MSRLITVTSGKGGVGKTNISLNLSLFMASRGYRVCLFDADLGLANINILLNLYPEYNLGDVVLKNKDVKDILIKDYEGVDIIPGSSGVEKMADLEISQMKFLIKSFSMLADYDYVIFDTSAGISKNVISFCMASTETILVITPEPTSLTDAYALLKILNLNSYSRSIKVVVNQVKSIKAGKTVYEKFEEVVKRFLNLTTEHMGTIVIDTHVTDAVSRQQPLMSVFPNSNASKCIKNIGQYLLAEKKQDVRADDFVSFWKKYLGLLRKPLKQSPVRNIGITESENLPDTETTDGPLEIETQQEIPVMSAPQTKFADTAEVVSGEPDWVKGEELKELFGKLVENISSLSQDLKAIRNVTEMYFDQKQKELSCRQEDVCLSPFEPSESSVIYLDFEAYLAEQGKKESDLSKK